MRSTPICLLTYVSFKVATTYRTIHLCGMGFGSAQCRADAERQLAALIEDGYLTAADAYYAKWFRTP